MTPNLVSKMQLNTEIVTSRGVCECIIKQTVYECQEAFEVDLWQGATFLESQITVFRAGVFVKWNGKQYTIVRRKKTDYANEYWLELESLISNTILVNE